MIYYNFNEINLPMKIILRSEFHVTYDVFDSDLNVAMIHVMYVWDLDQIYVYLIIKHRYKN